MTEIARYFRLEEQSPLVRLVFAFCTVVVTGTLFFWIFLSAGSLIFGIPPRKMIIIPDPGSTGTSVAVLKYVQFSQQTGLFLLPALLLGWLMRKGGRSMLGTGKAPVAAGIMMVVIAGMLLIPAVNYTAELNSGMSLPQSLSAVQEWMRSKEDIATRLTTMLIGGGGLPALFMNFFLMALIPALSEEMIFRGVFQKILADLFRSGDAAVWVTALIFSSIHFQFFGFLPRFLLGLFFGYLFYWSGNLWYAVIAHFLNNAMTVTAAYFSAWKPGEGQTGSSHVSAVFALVTALLAVLALVYFRREVSRTAGATVPGKEGASGSGPVSAD